MWDQTTAATLVKWTFTPPDVNVGNLGSFKRQHPNTGGLGRYESTMAANDTKPENFDKQVFTTGEAAEICRISQQTIIRCFDNGRLRGFRVPGTRCKQSSAPSSSAGRFRRIPREELLRFMRDNDIPTDDMEGGKAKILVVDDDEQIIELFLDVFRDDDRFEVRTAATGYDAGVITEQFHPDLMILDFMLPDINGNVVCKTVRQNSELAKMKIIIVSGVIKQEEIDDLLHAGADAFVKKPFNIEGLIEQIRSLIDV